MQREHDDKYTVFDIFSTAIQEYFLDNVFIVPYYNVPANFK